MGLLTKLVDWKSVSLFSRSMVTKSKVNKFSLFVTFFNYNNKDIVTSTKSLTVLISFNRLLGLHHQEVARLIAESFARRDRNEIEFLVVEAKKSNLEPKPTALIFLEA